MTVLIISSLEDIHTQAVMQALVESDVAVELLDLSEFPRKLALSMTFENGSRNYSLRREGRGGLDLSTVDVVWWRRPQPFGLPAAMRDPIHRRFATSETTTFFNGLYQSLDAFWINDPFRDAAAAHKPWQLALAQAVGLDIPPTLMTNDPVSARQFWLKHQGDVIFKQFLALPESWRETRRLRRDEERFAEALQWAPVIFQRHVEATADLRVIAIGEDLYAAAADVREAAYPLDVRMNLDARYEPYQLPSAIRERLRALMRRLGLEYGAIDLRVTPEGRHVFLEINPAGQFLYIETATGQKIAAGLASHLARHSVRGRAPPSRM
jgi:glutathione synthase/RimK-type ligase-like ATP-grasp enzyme